MVGTAAIDKVVDPTRIVNRAAIHHKRAKDDSAREIFESSIVECYPTAAKVGPSGLSEPSAWKNGGHAMSWAAAMVEGGTRFLYLLNSHGNRYEGDKYHSGCQPGCWISEQVFGKIANGAYRYGNWFVNVGEMG